MKAARWSPFLAAAVAAAVVVALPAGATTSGAAAPSEYIPYPKSALSDLPTPWHGSVTMTVKQKYSSIAGNLVTGFDTRTYTVVNVDGKMSASMSGRGTFRHTYANVCGAQMDGWDWAAARVITAFDVRVTNAGIYLSAPPVLAPYISAASGLQGPADPITGVLCPDSRPTPANVMSGTGPLNFFGGWPARQTLPLHTSGSRTGSGVALGAGSLGESAGTTTTVTWNLTRGIAKVRGLPTPPRFCNDPVQVPLGDVGTGADRVSFLTSTTAELGALSKGAGLGGTVISVVGFGCKLVVGRTHESSASMESACAGLTTAGITLGIGGLALAPTIVGGLVVGGLGLVTGGLAAAACEFDPPDPAFRTIATPVFVPVKGVARAGVSAEQALVLTAIANSFLETRAVARAMMLCINRASGAAQAKNALWESRQRECAAKDARRLAGLYRAQGPLRKASVDELRKAGVPNAAVSAAQADAALLNPSASARQGLKKLGIPATRLAFAQSQIGNVKGKRPATIYDAIDGRATIAAVNAGAKAFDQLAKKYS